MPPALHNPPCKIKLTSEPTFSATLAISLAAKPNIFCTQYKTALASADEPPKPPQKGIPFVISIFSGGMLYCSWQILATLKAVLLSSHSLVSINTQILSDKFTSTMSNIPIDAMTVSSL